MNKPQSATEAFQNGCNCSQAVFTAFSDELDIDHNLALKVSNGFGGGMGRTEMVCGAVSGGIMAIGAKFGKGTEGTKEDQEITYTKVQELIAQFTQALGTPVCKELLSLREGNLASDAGQKEFVARNLKESACIPCVKKAVELLEPLLHQ